MKLYTAHYHGHRKGRYGTESGVIGAFSSPVKAEEAFEELKKSDNWLRVEASYETWKLDEIPDYILVH